MLFRDRLTLDKRRRNSDGYMAIHARAARTGIYHYLGREIDPDGAHFAADEIVPVYRPPEEVFDKAAVTSFIGKPITNDHPAQPVTAQNWRDLAGGTVMGAKREVAEDGDYLGFDLAFMDAALIADVDAGKSELSNGYGAELVIKDGITPEGEIYRAMQTNIRGNHVAVVDAGRAGQKCRIGDAAPCITIDANSIKSLLIDERTYQDRKSDAKTDSVPQPKDDNPMPKVIMIDGLQVDVSNADVAEATIRTLQDKAQKAEDRAKKAETENAALLTDKQKLADEKADLEKQLTDSKPKPADLRAAAKSYADTLAKCQALDMKPDEDDDEDEMKRKTVKAKMGDIAANWTDDQIAASFLALTKDLKIDQSGKPAAIASAAGNNLADQMSIGGGNVRPITDARAGIEDARRRKLSHQSQQYRPEARA